MQSDPVWNRGGARDGTVVSERMAVRDPNWGAVPAMSSATATADLCGDRALFDSPRAEVQRRPIQTGAT